MTYVCYILLAVIALFVAVAAVCYMAVTLAGRRHTTSRISALPNEACLVVLGAPPLRSDGRPGRYYERRLRAAEAIYKQGKAAKLMLSGAKHPEYSEPQSMLHDLTQRGLPASAFLLDETGYRTWLSVRAAKQQFDGQPIVFVSQRFHNERAIFLARALGMNAMGYNAEHVGGTKALQVWIREVGSRMRAFYDVWKAGKQTT